jgi:DNA/RNA endonuclease YhcR with UshA esterase domain
MKTLTTLVVLSALALPLLAQDSNTNAPIKIRAVQAKAHVGAKAIVTGKVAEVNLTEKLARINLDQPFPNQTFTAVAFGAKTNLIANLDKLKDKTIEVSGTIAEYRNRPQIILQETNQLRVVEATAEAKAGN